MKCPFCSFQEDKVIDSRLSRDGLFIRRRRECLECGRRFTTHERVEEVLPLVVKKDGRREAFERKKIISGVQKACEKRPISINLIEKVVERIEKRLQVEGNREIPSRSIGEEVMRELHKLDQVAYVRFASVYQDFKDINQFMHELREILKNERPK